MPTKRLDLRPRFTANVFVARYGSRDEIAYWECIAQFRAETSAWLDVLLGRFIGDDAESWYDVDVKVTDGQPEKIAANWGPKLPWYWETIPGTNDRGDDLPF